MNERIKQLEKQAVQTISYRIDPHTFKHIDDPAGLHIRLEFDKEKFAELIVRECAQAFWTEECNVSDLALEEFKKNSKKIKEHFGVEE